MRTFKIHFIRHGLTLANLEGKYIGSTDVPLCKEGINRLNKLKESYNYPKTNVVYTSPLKRCKETAKIFYPEANIIDVPGLSECDFGKWEGKTAGELKDNKEFIAWLSGKETPENMHGESMGDFSKRICNSLEEIITEAIKEQRENTVIVTHGGVIMSLLSLYGLPRAKSLDWIVGNGCGYSVRVTPSLFMKDKVFEVYSKLPLAEITEAKTETKYIYDVLQNQSDVN